MKEFLVFFVPKKQFLASHVFSVIPIMAMTKEGAINEALEIFGDGDVAFKKPFAEELQFGKDYMF